MAAKRLRVEDSLRHESGRAARAYAEATFDTDRITDRFETVIDRAVARRRTVWRPAARRAEPTWTMCWSPAPVASSAGTSCAACARTASAASGPSTASRKDEWYQVFDDVENVHADLQLLDACRAGHRRRRHRLQPRGRHGRHGLHREQQGPVHAVGARLDARARGRPRGRRRAPLLLVVGVRLRGREAGLARGRAARASTTPTRPCPRTGTAGRSCSASAWPATSSRTSASQTRVGPLPQRLRARGHVGRRPREGARRHLPQGGDRRADRRPHDRDLGRRRADPQLHLHRRLPRGHAATHRQRRRRAAQHRQRPARHDQPARRHRRGHRGRHARPPVQARRAPGRARPQQRQHARSASSSGGSPSISLEDGLAATYAWVHDQVAAKIGA